MSIIYDALKKAEKSINMAGKLKVDKKDEQSKSKLFLIYILVACFGLFIGNIIFGSLSNPRGSSKNNSRQISIAKEPDTNVVQESHQETPAKTLETLLPLEPPSTVSRYKYKRDTQGSLVLNGVFFSENEGYALINNQIVKVGDAVGGATVKRINPDTVELEIDGAIVKLSTHQR